VVIKTDIGSRTRGSTHDRKNDRLARQANVLLAVTDRIAIDVAGLTVLKDLGSTSAIMGKKIFEQEQIARAIELGLGITRSDEIEIVTDVEASRGCADRLMGILRN